jgi:hypothetical protein
LRVVCTVLNGFVMNKGLGTLLFISSCFGKNGTHVNYFGSKTIIWSRFYTELKTTVYMVIGLSVLLQKVLHAF